MDTANPHRPVEKRGPLHGLALRAARLFAAPDATTWRGYAAWLAGTASGLMLAVTALVLVVGPYGPTPFSVTMDRPAVFRHQRYAFPALIRSGKFDGFIVGTSTARPLDPEVLSKGFGGHMANVAIYAATAYEQKLNAELIAREVKPLNTLVWGLDPVWCYANVGETLHRRQPMPTWLYDADPWNDVANLFNMKAVEVSLARLMYLGGMKKLRVRSDGYLVETPAEQTYTLPKAKALIWHKVKPPHDVRARQEPGELKRADGLKYPALGWIENVLKSLPAETRRVLVLPPVHIAFMPARGSELERRMLGCKAELVELARRTNAALIDFRFSSPLTGKDENFWDDLHHRQRHTPQVMDAILAGANEGRSTDISVVLNAPKAVALRQ